jgi:ribonuclease-3
MLGLRRAPNPYRDLEKQLGYTFRRRDLLVTALMHRSYRFENRDVTEDNQRMEFLGDAVLGLVVADHLYRLHGREDEGTLTDLRSRLTSGKALAVLARQVALGAYMKLGRGEEQGGGRSREALLADAFEAVLGAAYLDGGLKAADKIVSTLVLPIAGGLEIEDWADNPKGKLQDVVQRRQGRGPDYRMVSEDGPAHQKTFVVEAVVGGKVLGRGTGSSRRAAETLAAAEAVRHLLKGTHEKKPSFVE